MDNMLDAAKTGLQTIAREHHDPSAPVPGTELTEQIPLLPLAAQAFDDLPAPEKGKRGAGRPAGSKNRSTEEWRSFILSRYSSPLIALAEVYSRNVMDLAREFGYVDKEGRVTAKPEQLVELFKIQLQAAKELAPYIHSKMPVAIEAGEKGLINLVIGAASPMAAQAIDEAKFTVDFIENETAENCGFADVEKSNSVVSNSVVDAKDAENQAIDAEKATDLISVGNDAQGDGR